MEKSKTKQDYAEKLVGLLSKKAAIDISKYDMNELVQGMLVELEHGSRNSETNVTDDDPIQTLKIAIAHLDEISDYYTRLNKMESEAKTVETKKDAGADENKEEDADIQESIRFKELCGLIENEEKKQIRNESFLDTKPKKEMKLLSESLNVNDFDVIKFNADSLGEKDSEEEIALYKMQKKSDAIDLEEL
jgi:hypothetical protein